MLLRLYLPSSRSACSHGWGSWPWGDSVICTDPHREGQSWGLQLKSVWEQSPCSSDLLPGATCPVSVTRPGDPQLLLAAMREWEEAGGQLLRCFLTVRLVPLAEVRIIRGGAVFWGGRWETLVLGGCGEFLSGVDLAWGGFCRWKFGSGAQQSGES